MFFALESNTGFRRFDVLVENQIPVSAARLWLLPVQIRYVACPLIALSCCAFVLVALLLLGIIPTALMV